MADPTEEKVWLALVPMAVMAAMHTTMISASMTAYSTAVGPSSFFKNWTTVLTICRSVTRGDDPSGRLTFTDPLDRRQPVRRALPQPVQTGRSVFSRNPHRTPDM